MEFHAAYRLDTATPDLQPNTGPKHWNFLELDFEPRRPDPEFSIQIRNLIDPPTEQPRGGGHVSETASGPGRAPCSQLPPVVTLSNADVYLAYTDGRPIRGTRSLPDGAVPIGGLIDVSAGTLVVITSVDDGESRSVVVEAQPLP